jgi:dihydrofolate reductase
LIALVVAHSANRVIGRDGGLPWHLPGDLKRFRELTTGHTVVMGRRTYESLPDAFRPLPNRRNVVLTSDPGYRAEGADVVTDLDAALAGDAFVIGGGAVYAQALPRAQRVYATELESVIDGDTWFPELPAAEWRRVERSELIVEDGHGYRFTVYDRVG